jgi:apolipoprotein D and lipocalin family protein
MDCRAAIPPAERMIIMGILNGIFAQGTENIPAICDVDLNRYLGQWYEIARLPHSFEEGLEYVTAAYNLRSDGKIEVINAGIKNGEKKETRGVATIANRKCTGRLKVSFFWPIKGEYNVIHLDQQHYQYAVVTSSKMSYLWILCREPQVSDELYEELVEFAASKGFDVAKLIRVKQAEN